MKIVIDIEEAIYKECIPYKDTPVISNLANYNSEIVHAVANGTPLPKGHGRLIDADAIEYTHAIARCLEDGHNWNELCVTENELYDAPTIIEADKAESEDKP